MRLFSTTFAITLLSLRTSSSMASASSSFLVDVVPARPHRDPDMMMRMLQKKENGSQKPPNGQGGGSSGGGSNDKKINNKKTNKARTTPILDYNNHNIQLDRLEYAYGTSVVVSFELTNDLKIDEAVLMGLDVTKSESWTLGLFMRMADPQGGALKPIATVKPTLANLGAGAASPARSLRRGGERDLQIVVPVPSTNATTTTYDILANMPPVSAGPPKLNYTGSAVVPGSITSPTVLNPKMYGTGFDLYLLDEKGGAIIGPATFYMVATKAMVDAITAETERVPKNNGLAMFDDVKKKVKEASEEKKENGKKPGGKSGKDDDSDEEKYDTDDTEDPATVGLGSGTNGAMVIATTPKLADYVLNTTESTYPLDATVVTVTYDLGSDLSVLGQRTRMLNNGNNKVKVTTTTTSTIARTTTTSATTAVGSPSPAPIPRPPPDAINRMIDGTDVKLFRMGVYMRMANPQDGKLAPIHSIPFCPTSGTSCTKTAEQLKSGTFEFGIAALDVSKNGYGYDVWILNGAGAGVAGPHTFYIANPVTEAEVPEL
ncbi:hypothetical protein ACHAXA_003426 [Cyclostephanos tholiformis]|uniref:Uncharacterized protein n=1 Tax=Cyclostephanos tholiformis TaxID=382380 RepID=A0ABD3SFW4_9STRA